MAIVRSMVSTMWEYFKGKLPTDRVARRIITLVSGTAMAQLLTICATPFVTRLYSPAEVGVISLFLAFFELWGPTLSLRYEYALLIADDDRESHAVHRLAIGLVILMSLLALPVLYTFQRFDILGYSLVPGWAAPIAVPIFLGYGIFMVYRSWALRAGMIFAITKASIVRAGANAITRILLGLLGGGSFSLFLSEVAGTWSAMLKLTREVGKHFAVSRPPDISFQSLRAVACKFIKFPAFEAPSSWLNQGAAMLPLPIVATLHGAAAAGWFGLARMLVAAPNSQIGAAVADVFQVELAEALSKRNGLAARRLFYRLLWKLALVGVAPLVLVATLSPAIIPYVFGENWVEVGIAMVAIAPWMYVALIVSPLSRALSVLQMQEYKLVYDISGLLFLTLAFFYAKNYASSFQQTIVAISIAESLGYIVYAAVLMIAIECKLKKPQYS